MAQYNLYNDGQYHGGVKLVAARVGGEADEMLANESQTRCVATVDADSTTEFDPTSSAFQRNQTNNYIATGMDWPNDKAVVVR